MTGFKKLLMAITITGAGTTASASDDKIFAGVTLGATSDKIKKSRAMNDNFDHPRANAIDSSSTFGVRLGQQNSERRYYATYDRTWGRSHDGLQLDQQNLLGSYDLFYPVTRSTQLFGGASLGLVKLTQETITFSRDSNIGYAVGGQAGVLQQLSPNISVELGYRYLRSNASTELSRDGVKRGSLDLTSSAQTYLSANYAF